MFLHLLRFMIRDPGFSVQCERHRPWGHSHQPGTNSPGFGEVLCLEHAMKSLDPAPLASPKILQTARQPGPNFCELDALPVDQIFEGNANLIRMRLYHYENMFDAYIKPYLRDQLDGFLLDNALVTRNGVYGRCWNSLAALGETICFDIRSSSEQCIEQ